MKLTVVGCSGSYPGPESAASCYLVEHEGYAVVLELGNGAYGALQRHIDPYEVDAVVISHLHADHCLDMCSYYVARKYCPTGVQPRIPVIGPADTAARLSRAYDLEPEPGMNGEFEFVGVADGWRGQLGPFTVTVALVRHPVEAYAVRLDAGGASLVYSGDTGPCPELVELSRGADLALYEASFVESRDNPADLHMTGRDAALTAAEAGVGQLVLTHLVPWNDDAEVLADSEAVDGANATLAHPGLVIELAPAAG